MIRIPKDGDRVPGEMGMECQWHGLESDFVLGQG